MTSGPHVVQKFHPNSGVYAGYIGLGMAGIVLAYTMAQDRTAQGITFSLGVLLAAGVTWVLILRPRAYATARTLVLRNTLSDVHIPLARVDAVNMRQTLNVYVGEKRYSCVGIGKSRKQLTRRARPGRRSVLSFMPDVGSGPETKAPEIKYEDFVVERILHLSTEAKKTDLQPDQVVRVPAWPEIIGLVAIGVAFVFALFG